MEFELLKGLEGGPRLGRLDAGRGPVDTPVFMPVATLASLKGVGPDAGRALGIRAILCNAFHLALRPGVETVEGLGGIHAFMRWDGTVVTDSGGFQVFSRPGLSRVDDEGVRFQSPVDGTHLFLTPEGALEIQARLGADICMPLDQPVPHPASREETLAALRRTSAWARRTREAADRFDLDGVFGIVQGGTDLALRERSIEEITALEFAGYALGGLSVGEGPEAMDAVVAHTAPLLPVELPRYLMGVGTPRDLLAAVAAGMDLFDCTLPTRNGRNGSVFTRAGLLRMKNAAHARDARPLEADCDCPACAGGFSRAYLRHLMLSGEMLGPVLCSLHNLRFYQRFMEGVREALREDRFDAFRDAFPADPERGDAAP